MRKWMMVVFAVGILVRLGIMAVAVHPDIRGHNLGGYLLTIKGQPLGMYDYISKLPRSNQLVKIFGDDLFVYPPLAYWVHGLWLLLPIYSKPLLEKMIVDLPAAQLDPGFWQLLVFLKFHYLLADIACLVVLKKILDKKMHFWTTVAWAVNLPVIYSAYMLGQFDVYIVLFMLVAVWFAKDKHYLSSSVALAISAGFKPIGLFLLPFVPGNRIKNVLVGLFVYACIIAPYALTSPAFRMYALSATQSDKIWYAKILVSGSQYLPLFLLGSVTFFWLSIAWFKKLPYWVWMMSPLLVFYSVTHYHPQWFAWISPFLLLAFLQCPKSRWSILTMLGAHLAVIFSFDNSLNFGLFGLHYSLSHILNDQNMSLVRGILAGSSLTLPWFLHEA